MFCAWICFFVIFVFLPRPHPATLAPLSRHPHPLLSRATLTLYSHSLLSLLPSLSTLTPTLTVPSQYHCTPLHSPHTTITCSLTFHTLSRHPQLPITSHTLSHTTAIYLSATYPLSTRYLSTICQPPLCRNPYPVKLTSRSMSVRPAAPPCARVPPKSLQRYYKKLKIPNISPFFSLLQPMVAIIAATLQTLRYFPANIPATFSFLQPRHSKSHLRYNKRLLHGKGVFAKKQS